MHNSQEPHCKCASGMPAFHIGRPALNQILCKDFVGKVDYLIQIALFANQATTPSNCTYLPSQLAYGVDMIFSPMILINWVALKQVR